MNRTLCLAVLAVGGCTGISSTDGGTDVPNTGDTVSALDGTHDVVGLPDTSIDHDANIADASDATASDATTDAGSTTSSRWVMGYYVGYGRAQLAPADVDFASLTHIAVGPVIPRADGTLDTTFDIDATMGPAFARDVATRAHAAGRVAVLMIGGAGAHAGFVSAASSSHRAAFVSNLLSTMHAYGYDGLDLDWEPVDTADQAPLEALARDLRAAEPGLVLTIPVMWLNANSPSVPAWYGTIAPLFDQMNLMTYGMAGAWDGWRSWHSSAIRGAGAATPSSVESSVNGFLAAGVPAARLGIGVGFYGSCWSSPVTAPDQALGASQLVADDNVMSYAHIMASYFATAAYHFDANAGAPYLSFASAHGPEGCTFVSYEDEASVREKGQFVADHHLGGGIIWALHEGHIANAPAGQRDPVLRAMRESF